MPTPGPSRHTVYLGAKADSVLSRVLQQSIKYFFQMIFSLVLERMGQCWKKWDNVGKNGTTFEAFFVPFFPTPLYFVIWDLSRRFLISELHVSELLFP